MSYTFSIKLPDDFYGYLNQEAERTGLSKGAIIKNALGSQIRKAAAERRDRARAALKNLQAARKTRHDAALLQTLRNELAQNVSAMTPEEEVLHHRSRGLF